MKRKTILTIPAIIIAVLAVGAFAAPTVQAHDGAASGTCQGGITWDFHNYDREVVNTITVTIDGTVRYTDGDFKASDTGAVVVGATVVVAIATDKTQPHSVQPALPVTGGGDEVAFIAIAAGLIAVGVYLVIRGRRVP